MSGIDVARARAATPGCSQVLHLDHAGASLMSQSVLDAVVGHLDLEASVGGYAAASEAGQAIEATYTAIASMLGCDRDEIALTDSSTRGWAAAVNALPLASGDRLITTRAEYGSNAIALLQIRRRTGCELVLVEDDRLGQVDLAALADALDHPNTSLVSLTHVPTQSGLVNPAAAVGRLCRDAGAIFVLDACQSAGQLPLDVTELGCHVLTATGRKFLRGPRGTGLLYVRRELAERSEPIGVDMFGATWVDADHYQLQPGARRYELWEGDIAGRIGLGVAVTEALAWGLDAIAARNATLAEGLRARLSGIPGVVVRDRGERLCAITTFTMDGLAAEDVVSRLRAVGVNVSAAVATSAQHDLPRRDLDAVVRASVHYLTTDDELDRFSDHVTALVP